MPNPAPTSALILIGTYTRGGSEGIYAARLDTRSGVLTLQGCVGKVENPSFLAQHPTQPVIYAANETGKTGDQPSGAVSAFALDPATGNLTFLNRELTGGTSPCHVTVDATGRCVLVANYSSGNAALFPVLADGRLGPRAQLVQHQGKGPNAQRQEKPHAHSVTISPSNRFAYVADLGIDRMMVYALDPAVPSLTPAVPPEAVVHPGAGPRHFTFHPDGRQAYGINELDSTVTVYDFSPVTGGLREIQSVSTLPAGYTGSTTCADIHIDPRGRFLYGSNRGHDSLAVFSIAPGEGRLTAIGHQSVLGKTPRGFVLDPSGKWVVCANQDSGNIVVFAIDAGSGRLTPTGSEIKVPFPVCVRFVRTAP